MEPVFLLRATDKLMPLVVRFYATLAEYHGLQLISQQCHCHATAAAKWQDDHKNLVKLPDMPADAGRY